MEKKTPPTAGTETPDHSPEDKIASMPADATAPVFSLIPAQPAQPDTPVAEPDTPAPDTPVAEPDTPAPGTPLQVFGSGSDSTLQPGSNPNFSGSVSGSGSGSTLEPDSYPDFAGSVSGGSNPQQGTGSSIPAQPDTPVAEPDTPAPGTPLQVFGSGSDSTLQPGSNPNFSGSVSGSGSGSTLEPDSYPDFSGSVSGGSLPQSTGSSTGERLGYGTTPYSSSSGSSVRTPRGDSQRELETLLGGLSITGTGASTTGTDASTPNDAPFASPTGTSDDISGRTPSPTGTSADISGRTPPPPPPVSVQPQFKPSSLQSSGQCGFLKSMQLRF